MKFLFRLLQLFLWLPLVVLLAVFIAFNTGTVSINLGLFGYSFDMPVYLLPVIMLIVGIVIGGVWMRWRR